MGYLNWVSEETAMPVQDIIQYKVMVGCYRLEAGIKADKDKK